MFSLFRRKAPPRERTFKDRVEEFWAWYSEHARRFYETIENKECPSLTDELSAKVDAVLPGFAWEFGPGGGQGGHSFTLSGEGVSHKQFLAAYWKSRAPRLPGWTFHDSRQRSTNMSGHCIVIDDDTFNPIEFWVTPSLNEETEKVDLRVWHPKFSILPEKLRWTVLFLFLDALLGEMGTQNWIGQIDLSDASLNHAMPITELSSYIQQVERSAGWKKYATGEAFSVYRQQDPHDRFPRGDIIVGCTSQMALQSEYMTTEGNLEDPLLGSGADYVYAEFPKEFLPRGKESDTRGKMEDAADLALSNAKSGRCLGGALGIRWAYMDFMVFDGERSIELLRNTLRELQLPRKTTIRYFAKEKSRLSMRIA